MEYYAVSWQRLHSTVFELSQKIEKSKEKFDLIVAISRGGLTISHIVSDFLRLPITTFTISTYKDFKQHKVPEITLKIGNKLHNKKIILVDDVSDTGKTFIRGIEYLKSLGADHIRTASPFIKPWTKFIPDYYDREIDKWIIFPFDMRESVDTITRNLKKEKYSGLKIRNHLKKIGIPSHFINTYLPKHL